MRIVVSGGTGFIGRSLVRSLCERGDDVVVLSRGGHEKEAEKLGARPSCRCGSGALALRRWSPQRAEATADLVAAIDGADAVVHLAGAGIFDERWTHERKEVIRDSRVCSTRQIADAIRKCGKRPRVWVSGSAVGHYGADTKDRVLTEKAPAGEDFLAQVTAAWEAAADGARSIGVRVCHPRMGIVLGRRGGMLTRMLPAFRAYMGGPVGNGHQYIAWIHVADAVRALEHALGHETIEGPFNVTAPEPVTMNEFARALGKALDRPSSVRVPALAVKLAFGEGAGAILGGQRAVPQALVHDGFAFLYPEIDSALADLVAARA